ADGEKKNRVELYDPDKGGHQIVGDPDMREEVAFYTQNKLYQSDEQELFRCFFHTSCIPPSQRDSAKLTNDPRLLEEFKASYPQFTRRVMNYRRVPAGEQEKLNRELIAFLTEYRRLPSLYKDDGSAEMDHPFPRWPETKRPENPEQERFQDGYE